MGCMSSKPTNENGEKEGMQRNAKIEKMIKGDKKVMDRTIKILLLGKWSFFFSF